MVVAYRTGAVDHPGGIVVEPRSGAERTWAVRGCGGGSWIFKLSPVSWVFPPTFPYTYVFSCNIFLISLSLLELGHLTLTECRIFPWQNKLEKLQEKTEVFESLLV